MHSVRFIKNVEEKEQRENLWERPSQNIQFVFVILQHTFSDTATTTA